MAGALQSLTDIRMFSDVLFVYHDCRPTKLFASEAIVLKEVDLILARFNKGAKKYESVQ